MAHAQGRQPLLGVRHHRPDPQRQRRNRRICEITRDVTERVESQRILRETQEQLALSQRLDAVGQLSGGIAHDFNNLLMIIMGNLDRVRHETQGLGTSAANVQRSIANAIARRPAGRRAYAAPARVLAPPAAQPQGSRSQSISARLGRVSATCARGDDRNRGDRRAPALAHRGRCSAARNELSSTSRSTPETRCRMAAS